MVTARDVKRTTAVIITSVTSTHVVVRTLTDITYATVTLDIEVHRPSSNSIDLMFIKKINWLKRMQANEIL